MRQNVDEALNGIFKFYEGKRNELIPVLQEAQGLFGYLP